MRKEIKWILLIGWMTVIFVYSNQPAEISDEKSRFIIYVFDKLGLDLNGMFGELASFLVRKAAHFGEYFILSLLIYNVSREEFNMRPALIISVLGVFLYACSDEFHQTFVPGREGRIRDVLIDTAGGTAAAAIMYTRVTLKKSSARKKKELIK